MELKRKNKMNEKHRKYIDKIQDKLCKDDTVIEGKNTKKIVVKFNKTIINSYFELNTKKSSFKEIKYI